MKQVITVDGKPKHVFVLRETEQHYVYISLHHIDRVDYERMLKLTQDTDTDLLEAMRTQRFDNGMIGLNLYKDVIKTSRKNPPKEEPLVEETKQSNENTGYKSESNSESSDVTVSKTETVQVEEKPKPRRRPGRPKKNPTSEK